MKLRLNKYLADCGIASRRGADALIAGGKVSVNGRRADVGTKVDAQADVVTVNGRRLKHQSDRDALTIVLNKPAGVITTLHDEHGRPSVAQFLPPHRRLFPVGRLDADTTGLLLCTTDGALARWLMHPSSGVVKRYEVIARGNLTAATAGILGATNATRLPDSSHHFAIVLTEGKNRQVRRMCASVGLRVLSLRRTQFGPVRLGSLKIGSTRMLTDAELRELNRLRAERA